MLLALLVAANLAWLVCSVLVCVHAFQRSVGTGFMVLCVPCYIFFYAFTQFEHPRKNLIVTGLCASAGLAVVLTAATQMMSLHGRSGRAF